MKDLTIDQTLHAAINPERTALACYADSTDTSEIEFVAFEQLEGRKILLDTNRDALVGDLENLGIYPEEYTVIETVFSLGLTGLAETASDAPQG